MRFYLILSLLVVIVLGLSCGSRSTSQNSPSRQNISHQKSKPGRPRTQEGIPVEVTPVVRGDISSYLLYNATLETEEMVDIYSRISGLVEKLFVEEGDWVKKDEPLLQLEQDEYLIAEQKARYSYEKQRAEFLRFKALKEKNMISEDEFEDARLNLQQAELQWKQAKLNLDYTIVRSPIKGVVGERMVRLGDRIQPTTRLFTIADLSDKVVKVYVPQDEMLKIYKGQKAIITTDVLPEQSFEGWVKRISPIVDATSGTFKITVGVKDPGNKLRPGMFLSVRLIVDAHQHVPLIPKAALIYENERSYYFVVEGDSVRRVALKKGFEDSHKVEVLNPVDDSTLVVIVGQEGLRNGNRIRIVGYKYFPWQGISPEHQQQVRKSRPPRKMKKRPPVRG